MDDIYEDIPDMKSNLDSDDDSSSQASFGKASNQSPENASSEAQN